MCPSSLKVASSDQIMFLTTWGCFPNSSACWMRTNLFCSSQLRTRIESWTVNREMRIVKRFCSRFSWDCKIYWFSSLRRGSDLNQWCCNQRRRSVTSNAPWSSTFRCICYRTRVIRFLYQIINRRSGRRFYVVFFSQRAVATFLVLWVGFEKKKSVPEGLDIAVLLHPFWHRQALRY
jgi:hypothetical protein